MKVNYIAVILYVNIFIYMGVFCKLHNMCPYIEMNILFKWFIIQDCHGRTSHIDVDVNKTISFGLIVTHDWCNWQTNNEVFVLRKSRHLRMIYRLVWICNIAIFAENSSSSPTLTDCWLNLAVLMAPIQIYFLCNLYYCELLGCLALVPVIYLISL